MSATFTLHYNYSEQTYSIYADGMPWATVEMRPDGFRVNGRGKAFRTLDRALDFTSLFG